MKNEELIYKLAYYFHETWSDWMEYMFSRCVDKISDFDEDNREIISTVTIPTDMCQRWSRQMQTEYRDLPEEEKKSDIRLAEWLIQYFDNNGYEISKR